MSTPALAKGPIARRFRGFLPVVIDIESGGFNPKTDALLEIAAVLVDVDVDGRWYRAETVSAHVKPFPGSNIDQAALEFTGIDPYHPFRLAVPEEEALGRIFGKVRQAVSSQGCTRAVLVGHNAAFDISFLKAAVERTGIKRNPFHAFSTFDTVSLAGLAFGQTVLSRAVIAAGLEWQQNEAHSAIYDAQKTADLFCTILNMWDERGKSEPVKAAAESLGDCMVRPPSAPDRASSGSDDV